MRSALLFPLALFFLVFLIRSDLAAAGKRPNILFILSDDQSYKTVGSYLEAWPCVVTRFVRCFALSATF